MNLPLLSRAGRGVLFLLVSLIGLLGLVPAAQATHIRAGQIQATGNPVDPRKFSFKLTIFTDATPGSPGSLVPTPTADIFFGDGTYESVPQTSLVKLTGAAAESFMITFEFSHTYNAPKQYKVSYIGENRKQTLVNIPNSQNQTFYLYTLVTVDPAVPFNHSPVLNNPALDKASRQQVFLHNPAATDFERDSLSYELRPSQSADKEEAKKNGNQPKPIDCLGFRYPNVAAGGSQVEYHGPPVGKVGQAPIFQIDPKTGEIVWNSPEALGDYNVAFVVREWRRTGSRVRLIGEVVRDMQIIVENANNLRPIIKVPADLCVVAGVPVRKAITATDPDNDPITLTAYGLPIGASFTITPFVPPLNPPTTRGIFTWTPSCADIATQPYQILFKAQDDPGPGKTPLIDELTWRIRVVGPSPENVTAAQVGSTAVLNWDAYACQNPGARMLIYRKEGCTVSTVDTCVTGISASSGYVKIGDVPVSDRTYTDKTGTLKRGKTYSYRLYVQFALPSGGASLASKEACVTIDGKAALFTNVTVDVTSPTNGELTVRWTKPRPDANSQFNPPSGYNLYRSTTTAKPVFEKITTTALAIDDTTYVDKGRNTQDDTFTYRLEFFSNALPGPGSTVLVDSAGPASSVRLEGVADPANLSINLSWTYNVPWDNSQRPVTIFRREAGGTFVQLASAPTSKTGGSYVDKGTPGQPLTLDGNYCYYVRTDGTYELPTQHLINLSQEKCVQLKQMPCIPVLRLKPVNCDSLQAKLFDLEPTPINATYTNYLSWTLSDLPNNCSKKITNYQLYYRPDADPANTDLTGFTLLATLPDQSYAHTITNSPTGAAGCYYVVAIDSAGTASGPSNIECKDNCLLFLMPNIFTPNGDGKNDKLRPKVASPVRKTHFQAFNRWGVKIYDSSSDPLINWDGGGPTGESGKGVKVVEGVYYYLAEVEFADLAGTKRTYKGWVEITR